MVREEGEGEGGEGRGGVCSTLCSKNRSGICYPCYSRLKCCIRECGDVGATCECGDVDLCYM